MLNERSSPFPGWTPSQRPPWSQPSSTVPLTQTQTHIYSTKSPSPSVDWSNCGQYGRESLWSSWWWRKGGGGGGLRKIYFPILSNCSLPSNGLAFLVLAVSHWFLSNIIWKSMSIKGSSAKYKAHQVHITFYTVTVGGNSPSRLARSLALVFFLIPLPIILTPILKQWEVGRIDPDRRGEEKWRWIRGRGAEERHRRKGRMDYSERLVTAPDSALYRRELSNARPHAVSVE